MGTQRKEGGEESRKEMGGGGRGGGRRRDIPAVLPAAADSLNIYIIEVTSTSTCLNAQGF